MIGVFHSFRSFLFVCRGCVGNKGAIGLAALGLLAVLVAVASGTLRIPGLSEDVEKKTGVILAAGQSLQEGFSRILSAGVDFDEIVVDPTRTSDMTDLFAANGGGVTPPSVAMAATPATDVWYYPLLAIPGVGSAAGSRVAVLHVSKGVCNVINHRVNALPDGTADAQIADLGSFAAADLNPVPNWPKDMIGRTKGCVGNKTGVGVQAGFYFYQVIGLR